MVKVLPGVSREKHGHAGEKTEAPIFGGMTLPTWRKSEKGLTFLNHLADISHHKWQRLSAAGRPYAVARFSKVGENRMAGIAGVPAPLSPEELRKIDAYWRACNYLAAGMIYLRANPLLREPLKPEHIKNRLLGHWGSDPGQSFVWVHLNRLIKKYDLSVMYISGPGHGAPATLANCYLEGYYSEIYPDKSRDEAGLLKFFKQFSFPGGIGSHCTPETPGSIHEGGELGYSISHAYGAAFDNPDLIVTVVVGDGEAETGPLATSWHSNKFLNSIRDGAVLPVLHLNGYKIANPTILARIPREELEALLTGYGHKPYFVEGDDPAVMHQKMASTLEQCILEIRSIQQNAPREPRTRTTALAHDRAALAEGMDGTEGG
jgi:xylulose-5-phosphate/fructose-6-phosphate phosphoketolase